MRRGCCFVLVALACLARLDAATQTIVVERDGSVQGRLHCGKGLEQPTVFRFGLPTMPAERRWQENGVLRGLWVKNGVRYLQTVVAVEGVPGATSAVAAGPSQTDRNVRIPEVLLVNIEGENTNAAYAEAFAELVVETGGMPQPLELKDELVWCGTGDSRRLVGALEIPESGIREASGRALKFYGSIPPSLKGSMTLKIPLGPSLGTEVPDWLIDLEFETALRRALRPERALAAKTNAVRVVLAE